MLRSATATIVALAGLIAVNDASAATATLTRATRDGLSVIDARLSAAPGERNDVTVGATQREVVMRDTATPPTAGPGCRVAGDTARCPFAPASTVSTVVLVTVIAGDGDDVLRIVGPGAADGTVLFSLAGEDGDDLLSNEAADGTLLIGGPGDDVLNGGSREDDAFGGDGADRLSTGAGDDELGPDATLDPLVYPKLFGLPSGADASEVGLPQPSAVADDVVDGGPGRDGLVYPGRTEPLRVDLADPAPDGSRGEADVLRGIEDVQGGDGDDVLRGDGGPNVLRGGTGTRGTDTLDGRGGDDRLLDAGRRGRLHGGAGDDRLGGFTQGSNCGAGRDVVAPLDGRVRDATALRRAACEIVALTETGTLGLRLRPVRRTRTGLALTLVKTTGSLLTPSASVRAFVGGRRVAMGSGGFPRGAKPGDERTLRLTSTRMARGLRLRRVRLRCSVFGRTVLRLDLPVRRS